MGCHDKFNKPLFAGLGEGEDVPGKNGLEWLVSFPFWMVGRQSLNSVQCKSELHIHRLLAPERTVIVERRNSLRGGYEAR